ncbi:MAG TPA: hypothetical protein PKA63_00565 [Oligoflexia bacterium]|nr:hypothetical protein [Oligoflexia bacterium]HMP47142.1 hypothetical protein [Oligoflexia bacterium]
MDALTTHSQPVTASKENWHIETISKALLSAEYAVFFVGIPILPPGQQKQELQRSFFNPLSDFIRCSLVSVPTSTLESASLALDPTEWENTKLKSALCLSLKKSTGAIIFFPLLSGTLVFLIVLGSIATISDSFSHAFSAAMAAALGAAITGTLFTLDEVRNLSFKRILDKELARRKGKFGSLNSLPVMTRALGTGTLTGVILLNRLFRTIFSLRINT